MSILPNNEPKHLHELDKALESRWSFDIIKNPLHPKWCDAKYLPFVAKAYDMDISLFGEMQAREALETAIWGKSKIGTIGAVKELLQTFDPLARIETKETTPKHNSQYRYDGTIAYRDYRLTHWAKYTVILTTPMAISQKEKLVEQLRVIAPARCELVEMDSQITIIHNGEIKYDGKYNYGGYING